MEILLKPEEVTEWLTAFTPGSKTDNALIDQGIRTDKLRAMLKRAAFTIDKLANIHVCKEALKAVRELGGIYDAHDDWKYTPDPSGNNDTSWNCRNCDVEHKGRPTQKHNCTIKEKPTKGTYYEIVTTPLLRKFFVDFIDVGFSEQIAIELCKEIAVNL